MARATPRLYVKLDVDYSDNAKMIQAGEAAELLYVRSLCLAKKLLTDGVVADVQIARFHLPDVQARADALVSVGLFKRVRNGYKIVGWLERNNSAKEVEEITEKRRAAGAKGGQANASDK